MSQSLANILIHLVFSTKDRRPFIPPEHEPRLHQYISTVASDLQSPVIFINGMPDHVHLLFSLSRNMTISEFVSKIKANSSRWMKAVHHFDSPFAWQKGYGAFSIGESSRQVAIDYIANQKEHHKKMSFQEELLALLRKNKVAFDEKYLWD